VGEVRGRGPRRYGPQPLVPNVASVRRLNAVRHASIADDVGAGALGAFGDVGEDAALMAKSALGRTRHRYFGIALGETRVERRSCRRITSHVAHQEWRGPVVNQHMCGGLVQTRRRAPGRA